MPVDRSDLYVVIPTNQNLAHGGQALDSGTAARRKLGNVLRA